MSEWAEIGCHRWGGWDGRGKGLRSERGRLGRLGRLGGLIVQANALSKDEMGIGVLLGRSELHQDTTTHTFGGDGTRRCNTEANK